jgi:hypothetical protein
LLRCCPHCRSKIRRPAIRWSHRGNNAVRSVFRSAKVAGEAAGHEQARQEQTVSSTRTNSYSSLPSGAIGPRPRLSWAPAVLPVVRKVPAILLSRERGQCKKCATTAAPDDLVRPARALPANCPLKLPKSCARRSDDTDARREACRCVGRSDRSTQDVRVVGKRGPTDISGRRTLVFPATNQVEVLTHRRPVARSGRRGVEWDQARQGGAAYFPLRSRVDTVNVMERLRQQAVPARPLAACQKGLRPRDRPPRTALLPFQNLAILPLRKGGKYLHADRPSSLCRRALDGHHEPW